MSGPAHPAVSISGARCDHLRLVVATSDWPSMGRIITALVESVAGCATCEVEAGQPCTDNHLRR